MCIHGGTLNLVWSMPKFVVAFIVIQPFLQCNLYSDLPVVHHSKCTMLDIRILTLLNQNLPQCTDFFQGCSVTDKIDQTLLGYICFYVCDLFLQRHKLEGKFLPCFIGLRFLHIKRQAFATMSRPIYAKQLLFLKSPDFFNSKFYPLFFSHSPLSPPPSCSLPSSPPPFVRTRSFSTQGHQNSGRCHAWPVRQLRYGVGHVLFQNELYIKLYKIVCNLLREIIAYTFSSYTVFFLSCSNNGTTLQIPP